MIKTQILLRKTIEGNWGYGLGLDFFCFILNSQPTDPWCNCRLNLDGKNMKRECPMDTLIVCIYCIPTWGLLKYIKTKLQITCFYVIQRFLINEKWSGTILHDFWKKMFHSFYSIEWPNFIVWLSLLCEILGNICIAIAC